MHNYVQEKYDISSYNTVVRIMKVWDFQRVNYPAFKTVYKHWLGIAVPKTVFRLIIEFFTEFKTNYLANFLTD